MCVAVAEEGKKGERKGRDNRISRKNFEKCLGDRIRTED